MMMMTGDVDLDAVTMAVTDLADLATMEDLAVLVVLAMAVGDGNIQPSITNKRGCHIGAHAFFMHALANDNLFTYLCNWYHCSVVRRKQFVFHSIIFP